MCCLLYSELVRACLLACTPPIHPPAVLRALLQETLGNILTSHKPEVLQSLWDFSRLPGETEEQERRRWREVAVSACSRATAASAARPTSQHLSMAICCAAHMLIVRRLRAEAAAVLAHTGAACTPAPVFKAACGSVLALQIGMQMSAEEVQCLVPLFQTYCERMQQLSADTAASLETLQEVQQVGWLCLILARSSVSGLACIPQ